MPLTTDELELLERRVQECMSLGALDGATAIEVADIATRSLALAVSALRELHDEHAVLAECARKHAFGV